jgi:predicted deacylase
MNSQACRIAVLLPALLFCSPSEPQSTTNSAVKPQSTSVCAAKVKASYGTGYSEGFNAANGTCDKQVKDAQSKSFVDGLNQGVDLIRTDLHPQDDKKIPLQILIEDIPGEDSYRLAAAELITTYFSQHYVVSQDANLILYISGASSQDQRTFSFVVTMEISTSLPAKIGDQRKMIKGIFNLSQDGGVLTNYTPEHRTQSLKESMFAVLSKGDAKLFSSSN